MRYLLDNVARIATKDYLPTHQDILHARKATKAITEYNVLIHNVPFRFVDVGGQRSQRQKWLQCFESVTSIVFIVSSSEYNQVLLEDRTENRLQESVNIFDSIVNNRCFAETSMILFLNKTDLLEEKLARAKELFGFDLVENLPDFSASEIVEQTAELDSKYKNGAAYEQNVDFTAMTKPNKPSRSLTSSGSDVSLSSTSSDDDHLSQLVKVSLISEFFSDFKGDPFKVSDVQEFMIGKFETVRRDKSKVMYSHLTTAVDTENIKYVFNAVRNTILQKNITSLMLQ